VEYRTASKNERKVLVCYRRIKFWNREDQFNKRKKDIATFASVDMAREKKDSFAGE
jgi:hypothetical protein